MKTNKMIVNWSWREIWTGQLWPVLVSLTLIIACVVALSTLALRVEKVMTNQGRALLAADLVLRSSNPIPDSLVEQASSNGLITSSQSRFQTMAFSDKKMQLVTVKSVESTYPLRGVLNLKDASPEVKHQVNPGELWVSPRLLSILEAKIGDPVAIGDAELTISGIIVDEPELAYNPFNSIPNLFIHSSDLEKTGAVQVGSRVSYRLFVNGEAESLGTLQGDYALQAGERWVDQNRESRAVQLMDKAKQYLSLTILMVILMAAVTLILTCTHYVRNRSETVSMLKSMGASRIWLKNWLATQVFIIFAIAFVAGSTFGFLLEYLLRIPLVDILPKELPSVGVKPFLFAIGVALCIGLPALLIPLMRLLEAPAINVIQKQSIKHTKKSLWLLLLPITALIVLYGSNHLVWMVLGGLLLLFLALAGLSYSLLILLAKFKWKASFKLALSRINRSPRNSMMQLAALSGSLMLVSLIWLIKGDLLGDWQQTLSPDTPNVFSINISPSEQQSYIKDIDDLSLPRSDAFAIVRGRVTEINHIQTNQLDIYESPDVRILKREVNFTWMDELPVYNDVVAGKWGGEKTVSVAQGVAEELGLKLGDTLTFEVNSQAFEATINSFRAVEWQSLKPNFVFIFSEDVLAELPTTWMVSFRAEENQTDYVNQLARSYPTVTLLDLRTMANKIQSLLRQISWSLTGLAALGVLAGVLLIFTLLRLSLSERKREITLYRTLGASKKRISNTLWAEYGLLGVSAGLVAAIAAEIILFSLMTWGFELPAKLHPAMWVILPLLSVLVIFISLSSVIKQLLKPLR